MNYEHLANRFVNTHAVNCHILFELISKFMPKSTIEVLDFGCGTGNYIKAINTYTSYHVYGVEPCKEMIKYARKKNPTVTIKQGSHNAIPYPDNFFDYVYMTNVVHHVADISSMYTEIYRVLKPKGILCICTESRKQLLSKYWIKYFPSIIIKDLQRFPSISKLKSSARRKKFVFIKTTYIGEKKHCHITNFILSQVRERSMSVLSLISDKEYIIGSKKLFTDYKKRKIYFCDRGYTFLWLQKEKE
ncbi:MAG: class I SAM-dependent methyltransferase [Clostridia bacterium]|nr:class I SAM-dependent methyltransferase [Clostridia bacterium]